MKNGTVYATRLKKAYTRHLQSVEKPEIPDSDDPLRRLATAILGVGSSDVEAERALDRAFSTLTDWNELRVSSAEEVHAATGDKRADGVARSQRLIDALNAIYNRENRLSLERLRTLGRREARQYLEALPGVDEFAVASVLLWSLGGHGIPVNNALLKVLQEADLVHPEATRGEVQAFLERHVSATDAKNFCLVMQSFAPKKKAAPKKPAAQPKRTAKSASKRKNAAK